MGCQLIVQAQALLLITQLDTPADIYRHQAVKLDEREKFQTFFR
jgi:hypothetical protein